MVGKEARIDLVSVMLVGILVVFSIYFVIAEHVIKTSSGETSFSMDEEVSNLYNISVNNTDAGIASNITQVNITFPGSFTYVNGTSGTNSSATFTNTTISLIWANSTYVVNGSTVNYFWFNATVSLPGTYNITVITTNSTGDFSTNLSVTINDTTSPTATFGTNPIAAYNSSSANVTFELKCADDVTADAIQLWSNFSGTWLANQTNSTSVVNDTYWNVSVTGISDGKYIWGVYCNDSSGSTNWTTNRTVIVDITNPVVSSFSCTSTSVWTGETITCSCSGTDATSGVQTTSYTANPSTSSAGTYSTSCTVTDYAGNSASSSISYSVTSSSGGGTPSVSEWAKQGIHSWTKITPGVVTIMKNFDKTIGIKEIQIEVNNPAQNVKITVRKYDNKPAEVTKEKTGKVYKYIEIITKNLKDKLKKGVIKIQVEKDWFSNNSLSKENISMFKFNDASNKWDELITTYKEEDSENYYYDIELTSFSFFAIGEKSVITEEVVEEEDLVTDEGEVSEEAKEEKSLWWLWVLIAVVVAAVVAFIVFKRR